MNRRLRLRLTRCLLAVVALLSVADAFAAKKKGGKKGVASNPKGFGAKPPTFDEVIATFKTRMGQDAVKEKCPCGSGSSYGDCCSPYHSGAKFPETPSDVLKTRYSAFCYRIIPYIISTTHPVCRDYSENKIKWAKEALALSPLSR